MARFRDLTRRLEVVEKRVHEGEALLHFQDDSTRVMHVRDPLSLLIAAWGRRHSELVQSEYQGSPYDPHLDLLANAEAVDSTDNFFHLAFDVMHEKQREEQRTK